MISSDKSKMYYDDIGVRYTQLKKQYKRRRRIRDYGYEFLIEIFRGTPTLFGHLMRRITYKLALRKCGKGLIVHQYTFIKFPKNIELGDYCSINPFCFINALGGLKIGKNVSIAAGSYIISQTVQNERMQALGYSEMVSPEKFGPIIIEDNSWIAAGCLIGPGVKIGKNAQIGANSLVLKDVPDNCFVAGSPAKIIKQL